MIVNGEIDFIPKIGTTTRKLILTICVQGYSYVNISVSKYTIVPYCNWNKLAQVLWLKAVQMHSLRV